MLNLSISKAIVLLGASFGFCTFVASPASAQIDETCPTQGEAGFGLLSGHWVTSNTHRTVAIGSGLTGNPNLFVIRFYRELSDPIRSEFRLFDGTDIIAPNSYDDGSIALEGTNLEISQMDTIPAPFSSQGGCWWVPSVSPTERPYRTIFWTAKPRTRSLIAHLQTPRTMVLGLSSYLGNVRLEPGAMMSGCPIGTATIIVDGAPLRARDGSVLTFLNGTSIAFVGRTVEVGWEPGCPPTNRDPYLRGSIKIEVQ